MQVGSDRLFSETSPHARCLSLSKELKVGMQISPALKNPKKHVTAAAHSIMVSGSEHFGDQYLLSLCKIAGVMGRRILGELLWAWSLWMPDWTRRRRGIDESCLGSGKPSVICMCLMAARYTFIV